FVAQFLEGFAARIAQGALIGAGAAADDVADAGEQILEDVGADDHLAGDDAQVLADRPALERRRSRDDHHRVAPPRSSFQALAIWARSTVRSRDDTPISSAMRQTMLSSSSWFFRSANTTCH